MQDRGVGMRLTVRRVRPAPVPGSMSGELVDWLTLGVSSGFSIAALVQSYRYFRASLPPRLRAGTRLVVEHGGVRLVIEEGTAEDAARIAQALAALDGAQPPDATRIAERLRAARPVLVDLTGDFTAAEAANGWTDRVDIITARSADRSLSASALLIRPDGYLAWATDDTPDSARRHLHQALTTWFGTAN
ncbi:hypothetical protein [Streptomyces sp. NPDC001717]|uniref:effector-associated constant component EACC1 n=1 Tax=Streptomyces sp. NPDC001717 TaxID=3364604 RepID=UPI0036C98001